MAHPPQQNVPDLDAPGPAHTVVYPGDNKTRNYPIIVQIQAPQYTHITDIPIDCSGANCSISIAADGKSATVTITANTPMTSSRPFNVSVAQTPTHLSPAASTAAPSPTTPTPRP
ncbi:hypothetical protein GTW98_10860 [Streptomyces sp. SID8375]|uniref:hypothetical protein n=1 Tax=unclassified Streptomyces TaxID=2593676 RepID=UPI0003AA0981|nr:MULTISPECIES: hypothetical protein [unclassified Streptomyces]MYX07310.1 hypothetical protein [Streptomyces sp. SID8375]